MLRESRRTGERGGSGEEQPRQYIASRDDPLPPGPEIPCMGAGGTRFVGKRGAGIVVYDAEGGSGSQTKNIIIARFQYILKGTSCRFSTYMMNREGRPVSSSRYHSGRRYPAGKIMCRNQAHLIRPGTGGSTGTSGSISTGNSGPCVRNGNGCETLSLRYQYPHLLFC